MVYNLGNYRYKKGAIYKKLWWFIYLPIEYNIKSYLEGVRKVNTYYDGTRTVPPDNGSFEWFCKYDNSENY